MSLYDHRTFRRGDEWWAAAVHRGLGAGFETKPEITSETVCFTCISDEDRESYNAGIPTGFLNKLSYSSIIRILNSAEPLGTRLEMYPYNTPDADELSGHDVVTDEEGLRWILKQTELVRIGPGGATNVPGMELVCLDDSALRKEVLLGIPSRVDYFMSMMGDEGKLKLIRAVKGMFPDYEPVDQ